MRVTLGTALAAALVEYWEQDPCAPMRSPYAWA